MVRLEAVNTQWYFTSATHIQCSDLNVLSRAQFTSPFCSFLYWPTLRKTLDLLEGRPAFLLRRLLVPHFPSSIKSSESDNKKSIWGIFFSWNCLYNIHELLTAIISKRWKTRFHHLFDRFHNWSNTGRTCLRLPYIYYRSILHPDNQMFFCFHPFDVCLRSL